MKSAVTRPGASCPWLFSSRGIITIVASLLVFYLGVCCLFFLKPTASDSDSLISRVLRGPELSEEEKEAAQKAAIRAELGKGMWNMLHRMGAQYEKDPTETQQAEMREFFRLLSWLYPCKECGKHMRAMFAANPPDVSSNAALSMWLCKVHNIVNERLHKPIFPCTLDALKERWGECGCFDNATSTAPPAGSDTDTGAAAQIGGS